MADFLIAVFGGIILEAIIILFFIIICHGID